MSCLIPRPRGMWTLTTLRQSSVTQKKSLCFVRVVSSSRGTSQAWWPPGPSGLRSAFNMQNDRHEDLWHFFSPITAPGTCVFSCSGWLYTPSNEELSWMMHFFPSHQTNLLGLRVGLFMEGGGLWFIGPRLFLGTHCLSIDEKHTQSPPSVQSGGTPYKEVKYFPPW